MRRILSTTAVLLALAAWPQGQTPSKKVFISADMEGISGISASDQLSAAGRRIQPLPQADGRRRERGDPRRQRAAAPPTSSSTTRTGACATSASKTWIRTSA